MSIKLALLKSGETVISDAKELISDEKLCGYLFNKPHKIETRKTIVLMEEDDFFHSHEEKDDSVKESGDIEVILSPWIILTSDEQIPVPPDWIVAILEPIQTIKDLYEEKLNAENNKVSFTES